MIKGFSHVGINSKDVGNSIKFYCDILGLKRGKSVDMGEVILHYLILNDESTIELFEYKDKGYYNRLNYDEGAVPHFAFMTDNIEEVNSRLIENNIEMTMQLCVLEPLACKALLCKDPDGAIVEITQPIEGVYVKSYL